MAQAQTWPRQPVTFSTAELPPEQRIALWEDHNRHSLIGLRCHMLSEAPFDGVEVNLQLERMHLASLVAAGIGISERPTYGARPRPSNSSFPPLFPISALGTCSSTEPRRNTECRAAKRGNT